MKNSENKSLSNFSEYEIDNLEDVLGGKIQIIYTGMIDGPKGTGDIKIGWTKNQ